MLTVAGQIGGIQMVRSSLNNQAQPVQLLSTYAFV